MTTEQNVIDKKVKQRLEGLWWAVALIWAGLVFGAESLGILPQIGTADVWSWIFLGAGLFGTLGNIYRIITANVPNPTTWDWGWSGVILILGLGGFTTLDFAWPAILMMVGGIILIRVLMGRE